MNVLREYLVLNRIKNGASETHWRPEELSFSRGNTVQVKWPKPCVARTRRGRAANVDVDDTTLALTTRLPDDDSDKWFARAPAKSCKCACEGPCRNSKPPCECGCMDRRGRWLQPRPCVFTGGRCVCGCESHLSDAEWRELRLRQSGHQTEKGWNLWSKEPDEQLRELMKQLYRAECDMRDLEYHMASGARVYPTHTRSMRRLELRISRLGQRMTDRRQTMAADAAYESVYGPEPTPLAHPGELQPLTSCGMPRDAMIDGMCVAVQRCHTLRVLHRNISVASFAVQADAELPSQRYVVLHDWSHACFNPGNSPMRNEQRNVFARPDWGEVAPEMSGDVPERLAYGFEYDMWCLGAAIFEVLFETPLSNEIDPAEFTDEWLAQWLDTHAMPDIPNAAVYNVLLRVILTTNAERRASSYAAMNMTDGARSRLFNRRVEVFEPEPADSDPQFFWWIQKAGPLLSWWVADPAGCVAALRDHVRTCMDVPAGHQPTCTCAACEARRQIKIPPEIRMDESTRTPLTRVMYSLMRSSGCIYYDMTFLPQQILAVYSTIARAYITDEPDIDIDPVAYGFLDKAAFHRQVRHIVRMLNNAVIRL